MKRNYTAVFLMLFVSSITGGLALHTISDYAMLIGVGLGTVFLLCSVFFASKNLKTSKAQ